MSTTDTDLPDTLAESQAQAQDTRPRHRWTGAQYRQMGEVGLLTEDERVELIEGEIVEMPPIGTAHGGKVNRLNRLFASAVGNKAIVSVQNPVVLGSHSEPQPDIAILRWREDYYETAPPEPEDVLLLIEVSDTTSRYDREVKIPLYARHGIPEVWLLDLPQSRLELYRRPEQGQYRQIEYRTDGPVAPEQWPELTLDLAELLAKP